MQVERLLVRGLRAIAPVVVGRADTRDALL